MYDVLEVVNPWKWGQKAELARRAGISRQYLSDILNCRKRALPELALKLEGFAAEMHLGIKKEHFMYPTKAPEYKFNTPDVKKRKALQKRLKSDASFMNDVWKMRVGLATGRGRRPSRQKMSKRDLRIMGMIAQETVRLINLQEAIDPAGAKQNREKRAYIARQAETMESRQPAASTKAGDICSAMSGAPDKSSQ